MAVSILEQKVNVLLYSLGVDEVDGDTTTISDLDHLFYRMGYEVHLTVRPKFPPLKDDYNIY